MKCVVRTQKNYRLTEKYFVLKLYAIFKRTKRYFFYVISEIQKAYRSCSIGWLGQPGIQTPRGQKLVSAWLASLSAG